MKLPKELTTVTTLSKTVALIMFISLPIIAFIAGMNFEKQKSGVLNVPIVVEMPSKLAP